MGWQYFLATARSHIAVNWLVDILEEPPVGIVTFNGAAVCTKSNFLKESLLAKLSSEIVKKLLESFNDYTGSIRFHSLNQGVLTLQDCRWPQDHLHYYRPRKIVTQKDIENVDDLTKVVFLGTESECTRLLTSCNELNLLAFNTKPGLIEIFPKFANKEKGVLAILDTIGGRSNCTLVALGDGVNDIPLIKMADFGITFTSSSYSVQKEAHALVIPPNSGGLFFVTDLIKNFMLVNQKRKN